MSVTREGVFTGGRTLTSALSRRERGKKGGHRSDRGADRRLVYRVADMRLELLEVALEAPGDLACRLVVVRLVQPGAARIEHLGGNPGAALGDVEAERRFPPHRPPAEPPAPRSAP